MKLKRSAVIGMFLLTFLLSIFVTGCSRDGTIEEPELTVDYLTGEYAEQLTRDGAEIITGSITINEQKDKTLLLKITSKVIVESDDYEEGYYVADKNHTVTARIDADTRVTYIADDSDKPRIISIDDLREAIQNERAPEEEKLYDIYLMGEQTLLILAKEL